MSEEEATKKLNDIVLNITYYDSSDEETDYDTEEQDDDLEDEEEIDDEYDENTQDKLEFLEKRLEEVAEVNVVGVSTFRVIFLNKRGVEFVDEDTKCEFDYDHEDLPLMYDGGESYFLPYMKELCQKRKFLTPINITTNCSKGKFEF